jgi:spore germination cell wall hydrolase CwlJ-like protein|tara:strand:- start:345 stop:905 length:561 start_codon:yes stop_codon:yes gene_type:complete
MTDFLTTVLMLGIGISSPVSNLELDADKINPTNKKSIECLAMNMYHEARNQGSAGMVAVSAVVINRVNDLRFPNTICKVVEQGPTRKSWKNDGTYYPIKHKCQFSWYCDGKSDKPKDKDSYKKALDLSNLMLHNNVTFVDITDGALFYHADYVTPSWAEKKQKTTEIGDHIFYRWDETEKNKGIQK